MCSPVLLPGKSHGQRSLEGCSPWDHWGSDMTERLHFHFSLSCIGEGNGNPLQCSCLENARDGGAWWAAVYGVAQSLTRLKWLRRSSSSSIHVLGAYLVAQMVKNLPAIRETWIWSLGWDNPLKEGRVPTPVFLLFPRNPTHCLWSVFTPWIYLSLYYILLLNSFLKEAKSWPLVAVSGTWMWLGYDHTLMPYSLSWKKWLTRLFLNMTS